MGTNSSTILALDVGDRRVGVAMANTTARLPSPLMTLDHSDDILDQIATLVEQCQSISLVVGLPRGLEGQETAQTAKVRRFADQLQHRLTIPVYFQDEAVTSKQAEAELASHGVPYTKGDVDSLAATFILDDFLQTYPHET